MQRNLHSYWHPLESNDHNESLLGNKWIRRRQRDENRIQFPSDHFHRFCGNLIIFNEKKTQHWDMNKSGISIGDSMSMQFNILNSIVDYKSIGVSVKCRSRWKCLSFTLSARCYCRMHRIAQCECISALQPISMLITIISRGEGDRKKAVHSVCGEARAKKERIFERETRAINAQTKAKLQWEFCFVVFFSSFSFRFINCPISLRCVVRARSAHSPLVHCLLCCLVLHILVLP